MSYHGLRTRATWVYAILRTLEDEGIESSDILEHSDLSLEQLQQDQGSIMGSQVAAVWQAAKKVSGHPVLSLKVMDFLYDPLINAMLAAVQSSQDIRQALAILLKYYKLISLDVHVSLELGKEAKIIVHKSKKVHTLAPENIDIAFALIFRFGSLLSLRKLYPSSVRFSRDAHSNIPVYEDYFGCPVHFSSGEDSIVFPTNLLNEKVTSSDPVLCQHMERFLEEEMLRVSARSTELRIRSALLKMLPQGTPKLEDLSDQLNIGKRTLQRKLESEKTSFKDLLCDVRLQLAKVYLLEQQKSIQEVSSLLGFSEPSNFVRFFRQHLNASPREYVRNMSKT